MSNKVEEPTATYGFEDKFWTYADYLLLKTEERFEIFKGKLLKMSPSPNRAHQTISMELSVKFYNFFKQSSCHVFAAPFDVRFINLEKQSKEDKDIHTVLQPDLFIVCDEEKLDNRGCLGAPDLIVEILSPGNTKKEVDKKFKIYEEQGVREYWMVQPTDRTIYPYILEGGRFIGLKPISEEEEMVSHIFPDLKFAAKELYQ